MVHVAGTAGKGTVAAGIAAVASRPGCRVGLHLSPHVYDLRERFSVDGHWCSPDRWPTCWPPCCRRPGAWPTRPHGPPTYYEVTLAMALVHFVRQRCDLVVLETGLGGRFDATNTVTRADKLAVDHADRPRSRSGPGSHAGGHRRPEGRHPDPGRRGGGAPPRGGGHRRHRWRPRPAAIGCRCHLGPSARAGARPGGPPGRGHRRGAGRGGRAGGPPGPLVRCGRGGPGGARAEPARTLRAGAHARGGRGRCSTAPTTR